MTRKEVKMRGGWNLFRYYPSLEALLRTVYPEVEWQSEKFLGKGEPAREEEWKDINTQREQLNDIGKQLGINQVINIIKSIKSTKH